MDTITLINFVITFGVGLIAALIFQLYPTIGQLRTLVSSIDQKAFDAKNDRRADIGLLMNNLSDINRNLEEIKTILKQQNK